MRGRDPAQRVSDGTALALTAAAAAAIMLSSRTLLQMFAVKPAARDRAIELTLQEASPETPAAPPPPVPRPPTPRTVTRALPQPREPLPVIEEPAPANADLIAADPAPPEPPASGPSRADLEAQYAAALRADIDARTRPPDSAQYRLHRPSGEVHVRFVVLRSGATQQVAVQRSSGSSLLDEAAVAIVASGHYPPMPAKCFVGEAQYTFVVTIEFRPPGRT